MKQTVYKNDFIKAFQTIRPDNFTPYALEEMFDAFEQYEEDTGEEMELDVIAICCDFGQCTLEEINQDYSQEFKNIDEALDWLSERTWTVASSDKWVVFQDF